MVPVPPRRDAQKEQDMSAPASWSLPQLERFGRLWWLPAGGRGNGLSDTGWAPAADIDADLVTALLAELRAADVPAYAAPVTRRPLPSAPRAGSKGRPRWRVWVGTSHYSRAEETLRLKLPALLSRRRR
jgi:hypothetical protein